MLIKTLRELFKRDLNKLKSEIESYTIESNMWLADRDITNCTGNLCLHLLGNLNAFIGAELGHSGYIRQRNLEFSQKNVPRSVLIAQIEETILIVDDALKNISEQTLSSEYPLLVFKEKTTTGYFLMHLTTHFAYHLGQVNYHRRLLDN